MTGITPKPLVGTAYVCFHHSKAYVLITGVTIVPMELDVIIIEVNHKSAKIRADKLTPSQLFLAPALQEITIMEFGTVLNNAFGEAATNNFEESNDG